MKPVRCRWICVAAVLAPALLFAPHHRGGGRRGYWVNWRGRPDLLQPHEFTDWSGVARAVQTYLRAKGLVAQAWRRSPAAHDWQRVWVQVSRVAAPAAPASVPVLPAEPPRA